MRNLYPCPYVSLLPVSFVTAPAVSQFNSSLAYQTWKFSVGRQHGDDGFPVDVFM
jgi:hypothetical protein